MEVALKPKMHHTAVVHDVPMSSIIVSGVLSPSLHIDAALLAHLRARGVADQSD